ncbi:MAG TPA: T9SS type A sorting domain-containing protein [Bacteroidia bacterium]|jgi:hypothetical protein
MGGDSVDACISINPAGIIKPINDVKSFNLYPNPASDHLTIEFEPTTTQAVSMEIKNILGQSITPLITSKSNGKMVINVNQYPSGIYFIQMQSEGNTLIRKFIKEEPNCFRSITVISLR